MKRVLYADVIRMFRHNFFLANLLLCQFPGYRQVQLRILFFWDTELGHCVIRSLSLEAALSSVSRDTSTPGEKGITSYRNVGISSHPRRYPELFLHWRHLLFGDEGLGSRIWRSLAALHTTVRSLLAKNNINFYS
jgi:hypothetical protein